MKILIVSLQVSRSGSKGHLHPAIELAMEAKRRGHTTAILPLPSHLGDEDQRQIEALGIEYLVPPKLPNQIIKSPEELGQLAADHSRVHLAYKSFLIDPLMEQTDLVEKIVSDFNPEVVVYDLLAYLGAIIAEKLKIPAVGYCAGLKLVAPNELQETYIQVSRKIAGIRNEAFTALNYSGKMHHLELISPLANLVFATDAVVEHEILDKIHLVGPLHPSKNRGDNISSFKPSKPYAVLSFGSVLDPADYPNILNSAIEAASQFGLRLYIGSKKLSHSGFELPSHVEVQTYLPLPSIIGDADFYIHHGGANSFSEALTLGAKQILVPLTTDQPIQSYYLTNNGIGFSIKPQDVSSQSLVDLVRKFHDLDNDVHNRIARAKINYQMHSGALNAIRLLEGIPK